MNLLKRLFQYPALKDLTHLLNKHPIVIADVGAAGGVEKRWAELGKNLICYLFEPDKRLKLKNKEKVLTKVFNCGVWSSGMQKHLNLAVFPPASSLFEWNLSTLNSYLNASCHKKTGTEVLSLNSLEEILKGELPPQFIKIDAEGAELEILKGSASILKSSCLGLQVEVSFIERHIDAPFFSDIDTYLRKNGFELFFLHREHWIRNNNCFSFNSEPQLTFADAVYFLSKKEFIKRYQKESDFTKFIAILLVYRSHDYALELCEEMKSAISESTYNRAKKLIRKASKVNSLYVVKILSAFTIAFGAYLIFWPMKNYRYKARFFLKRELVKMSALLSKAGRDGKSSATIADAPLI